MKTPDEFKRGVFQKRDARVERRKRTRKQVLTVCLPLVALAVLCAAGLPLLLGGGGSGSGTEAGAPAAGAGTLPLCVQAAKPNTPRDLSLRAHYAAPDQPDEDGTNSALSGGEISYDELHAEWEKNLLDAEFPVAVNSFARDSTALLAEHFGENACYSPLSLYYALALAGSGAEGTTKEEFLGVLGVPDTDWLAEQCDKFYRLQYHDNPLSQFQLANSLWLDGHTAFESDFLDRAEQKYYASLFQADFSDPALGDEVTKWISENTHGLLAPEISFEDNTRLAILNTVYLNAQWASRFYEDYNTEEPFTKADGSKVTATFMHQTDMGGAYRGDGFIRASLPLREMGEMIFILPDEGVSPQELLTDPDAFEAMFYPKDWNSLDQYQMEWSVPKFSFSSEYELTEMLSALGLETGFDPSLADFSGISKYPLFLSAAKQGVHVGVDEQGVEAAAYTILEVGTSAAMPPDQVLEMKLDRPFLFAILSSDRLEPTSSGESQDSGSLLFVGVCGDPTAE